MSAPTLDGNAIRIGGHFRYAPKFLGPWERLNRRIDDLASEALAEIKCNADEAREAIDDMLPPIYRSVPYDNQLWALANSGMVSLSGLQGGMRALTPTEMQEMAMKQINGMQNLPWQYAIGGAGIGLLPWE